MRTGAANRRIRLLLVFFALVFAGVLARAVWLQGVQASSLERMALKQHRETVVIPAGRGTIFDRTGKPLAIGEQATTVYADPRRIDDPHTVAIAAGEALGIDPEQLYPQLLDRTRAFVYIQRKADPAKAVLLQERHIQGVGFYPEELRAYPQRTVAAQVLGYAGVDNTGLDGLERSLDPALAGKPGRETIVKDPFGRAIDVISSSVEQPGRDVLLTLDNQIQANAEAVLRETVKRWDAKSATAVVLDPGTGAVLAMAVAPGYDANRFPETPAELRRNRAITDTYEPGSTFKLVTVAGVLSERLVTPSTAFTLRSSIQVADRVINEHEPRPTERMTVAQILARSSNIGTITLAEMLGKQRLYSWIRRFGYGQTTGIDFPGESPGILLAPDQWSGSTIGNVPIGQGIAVTAVQMAAAYAAIANKGLYRPPYLVERIGSESKRPRRGTQIVSHRVAAQLMTMLRDVVSSEGGTGALAKVPGYTVAGKTGTASKANSSGGYSDTRYVASFVGTVPASHPRLVILVKVDEPKGAIYGGVIAAPAFAEIAKFDLQYLEVPPDVRLTASSR